VAVLAVCTFTDLRSRKILNVVVVPFLIAGFVLHGWLAGWGGIVQSLEGLAVGGGFFFVLSLMKTMGMGDVKLCAAIGVWIGPGQMFVNLFLIAMAGGLLALTWALLGGFLGELFRGTGNLIFGAGERGMRPPADLVLKNPLTRKIPYAPAIAIGTLISFFSQ
jgi:prepilin peptidase CpaA